MKKMLLSIAALTIVAISFAQTKSKAVTNYRIGIATSIPTDVYCNSTRVGIGSTFLEASCKPHPDKKFTYTLSAGYFRLVNQAGSYTQAPLMIGARYSVNSTVYFGAATGAAIYTKAGNGNTQLAYSPYIGVQSKHISVDARYFNFSTKESTMKTLSLVFSYTL